MVGPLCHDCRCSGQLVAGTYTINGRDFCERHYSAKAGQAPKPKATEVTSMKQIDWDKVQADRDAGMRIGELEKKYGVSNPTIYKHTKGSGKGMKPVRPSVRPGKRSSPAGFGSAIAELESRRAKLDAAIAVLRELE
jgi:hypothetical protein